MKYVYIQGQYKAELIYECKEYVKVVPCDMFEDALKNNPNARKDDFIYTFVPSLIKENERTETRR
jgi:hypothetical protein